MGITTQKKFAQFLLWVRIEIQWLQYISSYIFTKWNLAKNTKIVYTCEKLQRFVS